MFDNVSLRLGEGELGVNIIMMLIILLPFLVAFVLITNRLICGSETLQYLPESLFNKESNFGN